MRVWYCCDLIFLLVLLVGNVAGGSAAVDDEEWDDEEEYEDEDAYDLDEEEADMLSTWGADMVTKFGLEDEKGSDIGIPQRLAFDDEDKVDVSKKIKEARKYVKDVIMKDTKFEKVHKLCHNRNEKCAYWAVKGKCSGSTAGDYNTNKIVKLYMEENCSPVCGTCDQLHIETRCPLNPNAKDALQNEGDLNQMFERIISDPRIVEKYQPTVLSRPSYPKGENPTNTKYQLGKVHVQLKY